MKFLCTFSDLIILISAVIIILIATISLRTTQAEDLIGAICTFFFRHNSFISVILEDKESYVGFRIRIEIV